MPHARHNVGYGERPTAAVSLASVAASARPIVCHLVQHESDQFARHPIFAELERARASPQDLRIQSISGIFQDVDDKGRATRYRPRMALLLPHVILMGTSVLNRTQGNNMHPKF